MKYITYRRFKGRGLYNSLNIPCGTKCTCVDNIIMLDDKPVCFATSENAHQYFAVNEDGEGLRRGKLTQAIQRELAKHDSKHQARWDKIWYDMLCKKYKRADYEDYWLWNHEFFNASISDLEYIYRIIKEV